MDTAEAVKARDAYRAKVLLLPMPLDADSSRAFHAMVNNLPEKDELVAACMDLRTLLHDDECNADWMRWVRGIITPDELCDRLLLKLAEKSLLV